MRKIPAKVAVNIIVFFPPPCFAPASIKLVDVLPQLADKHMDICSNLKACKLINTVNKQIYRTFTEGKKNFTRKSEPRSSKRLSTSLHFRVLRDRRPLPSILVTVSCNSRCKATTDTGHLTGGVLTLEGRGKDTALPHCAPSCKVRL